MNLDALHKHHKEHHDLARDALRVVARSFRCPYPQIRERFIGGNDWMVTAEFWRQVNARRPGQFERVAFCRSCRKFSFTPTLAS